MTGINPPDQTSELQSATIAVLAVAAAEFLGCSAEDLQSIHDSMLSKGEPTELSIPLAKIANVTKKFYFSCFETRVERDSDFADNREIYEALKHVAIVIQPPASNSAP